MDVDSVLFSSGYLFGYFAWYALLIYGVYRVIKYFLKKRNK